MKRYLLFTGMSFYAGGGWIDFRGDYDTVEEAVTAAATRSAINDDVWYHIVDATTRKVVKYIDGCYCGLVPDELKA